MARSMHSKAKRERELRKQLKRREKEERRHSRTTGEPGAADPSGAADPQLDTAEPSVSTESIESTDPQSGA